MEDANPPVNLQTRKRRRTGTVQDEKLPKKLKLEKVKEAVVEKDFISKSSPVKRVTPPEPIGAKHKRKVVADDVAVVADDVAATSVKVAVVKDADVATKIVHTPDHLATVVTRTDKDLDVLLAMIVADVGVMDVAGTDVPKHLHTPDRGQIPDATDPGSVRFVRVVGEGMTDFNARSLSNKRYLSICSRYVGTLKYADAKFFATLAGEEVQLDSMTHVSELWENWNRNSHEIPQHVVAYVSRIRPDWGSEWWKVRHGYVGYILGYIPVMIDTYVSGYHNLRTLTKGTSG
ncbi:hypothetical protein Dimus_018716 [Dionaea muscipula]